MVPSADAAQASNTMRHTPPNLSSPGDGNQLDDELSTAPEAGLQSSLVEPVRQFDVRMGDVVFLTALAREAHESAALGLLTCAGLLVADALGARRQCTVVPTDSLGRQVKCDTPEGAVDAAAFMLVPLEDSSTAEYAPSNAAWVGAAAASASNGATASSGGNSSHSERGRGLLFGQPLLLQHVSSGRFLCNGEPNEMLRTVVDSAPAELARENGRLALLPPSLVTHGSSSNSSNSSQSNGGGSSGSSTGYRQHRGRPRENLIASCTFRFLPSVNHGRAEVFTGDPLLLTTSAGRLVRAGIPLVPTSQFSTTNASESSSTSETSRALPRTDSSNRVRTSRRTSSASNHGSSFGGALGRSALGADCPFDPWARPHQFEVDVSRHGSLHEARVAADNGAERGCVQWQLALAVAGSHDVSREVASAPFGSSDHHSDRSTFDHSSTSSSNEAFLSTGTVVQLECLEAAALVWAPSACHPLLTDLDGASRITRRPREVVLQALSRSAAAAAAGTSANSGAARAAVMGHSNDSSTRGCSSSSSASTAAAASSSSSSSSAGSHSSSSSSSGKSEKIATLSAEAAGTLPVEASLRGLFVVENAATWREDGQLTLPQALVVDGQPLRFKHLLSGAYLAARTSVQPRGTASAPAGQQEQVHAALVFPPCNDDNDDNDNLSVGFDDNGDGKCDFQDEAAEFTLSKEARRARFAESTAFAFVLARPTARSSPSLPSSSSSSSSSSPLPLTSVNVPLDAAVGWLTVAGHGPAAGAILGGFTACVEGVALEVSSHSSTGQKCGCQADQREELQCPLPLASASLPSFAPFPLVPDEHHWREMRGRSPLSFRHQSAGVSTASPYKKLPGALFQLKAVPTELVAVARFSLKCLGRVAAFERWLAQARLPIPRGRFSTTSTGGSGDDGDQDVATFTYDTPTDEELAAVDTNHPHVAHAREQLQPLLDALTACAAFLQGQWWPDLSVALHEFNSSSSNGRSRRGADSKSGGDFSAVTAASQRVFSEGSSGFALQALGASSSSSSPSAASRTATSAELSRRAQGLVRDARILELFLLVFRALRTSRFSGQSIGAVPALAGVLAQNEQCLLLAAQHNRRTQVAIACGRFQGSRCLPDYNPGWLAEATAVVVEWSSNKCAEAFREGRPANLLRTVLFQNPHLSARLLTAPTIAWFGGLVRTHGLLNHTVSLLSSACVLDDGTNGSGGSNALTQDRVHAWLAANNNTNNKHYPHLSGAASGAKPVSKERALNASVGLFFVRKPGPHNHHNRGLISPALLPSIDSKVDDSSVTSSTTTAATLADASAEEALAEEWAEYARSPHVKADKETFRRASLLLYGPERIFRLSVGIDPPERVQELYGPHAWCLSCHLTNSRHRHCAAHGALPSAPLGSNADESDSHAAATSLAKLSSMCRFIDEGEARDFAAYRATEPLEKDRLLPEVVTWLSPHTAKVKALRDQSNRAASSNGTTGATDGNVAHQADLAQLVRLARTSEEHRRLVRYVQANLNLHRALATSRRSSVREALQAKYPYELLLVGLNFYALGHELRTAFINLLDELYLGAYPHTSLPRGPQSVIYVKPLAPRPLRGSIHAQGAVATEFLPRFSAPGYNFVLPPDIRVALHQGDLSTEEWVRTHPSHAFLYRACPGKFDLLTESLMDALADERLMGLVAVNEQAWLQEQADSLEFLRASLGVTSKLIDAGFLYSVQDLQRLVAKLFTVVAALGASTDVAPNLLSNSRPYRSAGNTKAARSRAAHSATLRTDGRGHTSPQMMRRSLDLDRNVLGSILQENSDNDNDDRSSLGESPMLNSFSSPIDSSPMVLEMVNNPLSGSYSLELVPAAPPPMMPLPPQATQVTEGADKSPQNGAGESKSNRGNGDRSVVPGSEDDDYEDSDDDEDRVDDDLWDEVTVAAARKGLNVDTLKLVFGRANTAALVLHDELRPEQATDVVEERQLWTFGQRWHYTSKLPFVTAPTAGSSENPTAVVQYNKDLQVRKKGGFRAFVAHHQKQLWSSSAPAADGEVADGADSADDADGPELQGPCTAPDSPDGLPNVPGGSEASLPPGWTTWCWLEPWRLDTFHYPDSHRGSHGGGGIGNVDLEHEDSAWEYSSSLSANQSAIVWESTERRGHVYRRRLWRRRRERKSALRVALELVSQGHCSVSSCRAAIAASREHAISDARQRARTLHIAAVPVPVSRAAADEVAEESEGIWDDAFGISEASSSSSSTSSFASTSKVMFAPNTRSFVKPSAKRLDVDLLASSCHPLQRGGNLASSPSSTSMSTMSLSGTQAELNAVATLCVMLDLPMQSRFDQPATGTRVALNAAAQMKSGSADSSSSSSFGSSPALGPHLTSFPSTSHLLDDASKRSSAMLHGDAFENSHGGRTNAGSGRSRGSETLLDESTAPLGELEVAAALLTKYKCYGHTLAMLERVQDKAATIRVAALLERLREAFVAGKMPAVHVASQGSGSQGGNGDGEYERDLRRMYLARAAGNDVSSVHEVHRLCFHVSGSSDVSSSSNNSSSNGNSNGNSQAPTGNGNKHSENSHRGGIAHGYVARRLSSSRMLGREASASAQARVAHAQRTPDGRPRSAQEARMSTRRVVLFVRRLQQVFFDTGLHPKEVLGRFVPSQPANGLPPPKVGATSLEALQTVSKEDWALGVPPQPLDLVTFQWLLSGLGFTLSSDDVASLRDAFCDDGEAALEAAEAAAFAAGHRLRGGQGEGERAASQQARRTKAAAARVAERRLRAAQRQKHVELVDAAQLLACLEAVPPPVPAELSAAGEELWAGLFNPAETPALDPLRLSQPPPSPTAATAAASSKGGASANGSPSAEAAAAAAMSSPEDGLLPVYRIFLETSLAAASGAAGVAPTAFALAEQSLRCMFRAFETRAETLHAVEFCDPEHPPMRHSPAGHADPSNGDVVRGLALLRYNVQQLLSWARDGPDGSSDAQVASVLARVQTLFRYLAHMVVAQRRAGNSDASRALYQYLLVQSGASSWAFDMLCLPGITVATSSSSSSPNSTSHATGRRRSVSAEEQLEVHMDLVSLRTASAHFLLVLLEGCDHAVAEHIVRRWPEVCAAMLAVPDGAGQFKHGIVQVAAAMLKRVGKSVNESTLNSWAAAIRRWDLGTETEAIDEDLTRHEDAIAFFGLFEVFLMDCNDVPVPSIQDAVFRALTNHNLILTFYDASSLEPFLAQPGFKRRRALLRASEEPPLGEDASHAEGGPVYGSWDEMMVHADKPFEKAPTAVENQDVCEPEAEHYMIMLHARSLHCLSLCCRGTHETANAAALSAVELLPVPALVASLCDTTTDALMRSGGADWVPTVGAEAAVHMGRGIMVAPWGQTVALRAAAAFLDHVILCRTPPVGLDNNGAPSPRASAVEWPFPALRAVDRYNLLLWAADCGTLLRRFARTLKEHAAYARTDFGADAFARNRDKGQLRLSHGTVGAIYLASNGHVTAQTIHCLLGALVPALATLHLCLRPVPAHDPREEGQTSDISGMNGVEYSEKMSNAHAVAWTSIHSSLVALLESPHAVRHLQRVASAICPNLRYKLDNEFLAAARKLRARLLIDAMVSEEEEEDEETRSGSVAGDGSENGHEATSSDPVKHQDLQSVAGSAKSVSSVDSSFSFVDVCEVAEDARKDFAHLVEVSSDPRHHVGLDQGYCTFGSATSNLHSLGITVSNLPVQLCKPCALRKVFSRFGRIRFAYIRSMPARKNRNSKNSNALSVSGGIASVYFDLAFKWNFGGAFSSRVFDADEYMLSADTGDANKELTIRVVCLPTYTSNELKVKRSDRVVTLLQRISAELTDGVPVIDLTMAMNSLEVRRNFSMGTLHRHFQPEGKFGANWKQVELASKSNTEKWVKQDGGIWVEAPVPALTLVISWNPAIAAARCLDGVLPSFMVQSISTKKGFLSSPGSTLEASKSIDESMENSSETETVTSGITSASLEKGGLLKTNFSEAPKHVEGVTVLVEDSSIESFWRKYGEALRASTKVAGAVDAEANSLATFFLELPKRSNGTFREPEILASFINFVRTFLETRGNSNNVMTDAQDLTAAQIVELLCRMAALATPERPFKLNSTWSDLRLVGTQNAPTASADFNADRRVIVEETSPQDTSRLLFRTALVEAGALELLVDVLSQKDCKLCRLYHAGLKLGKLIFVGGNLRAQDLFAEHLRQRHNTYMVGMFCGIADFAAAHFRRRAAAINLLGIQVGIPYAGYSSERLEYLRARAAKKLSTGAPLDPEVFDTGISRRGGQRAAPVPIKSVLEFCKMLCENHHRPMQDILRDCQESQNAYGSSADRGDSCTDSFSTEWMKKLNAGFSVKFIESSIKLMGAITGSTSTIATAPDLQHLRGSAFLLFDVIIDFLTEVTQGPNKRNQTAIVEFQGSIHIVRCINILFSWIPGSHFLSIHSPFVNLCTDCMHKAVVLLHALIEGRPATFSDPVVWKIYSTLSASAFLYRLDRLASVVHHLDIVRHKKAIKFKREAKHAKLAQRFDRFRSWCGQGPIQSLHAERARVSFEAIFIQLRDGEQLSEIPPQNQIEAPWQRKYTGDFHYHNIIFIGAIFVTFVEALHSIEAPYGASRFRLHASRNSARSADVLESNKSELIVSNGTEENTSEEGDSSDDDESDANEGAVASVQPNATYGRSTDLESGQGSAARLPKLFGTVGDEAMVFEQHMETIRSLQVLQTKKFGRQRRMFSDLVLSIEVQDGEHGLVRVFFPRPAVCLYLSDQQKQAVYDRLDFTAADSQVLREFLRRFRSITDEISYKKRLANKPLLGMFLRFTTNENYEVFPWFIAMSINFMLAISISHTGSDGLGPYEFDPPSFERGVFGLGTLLLAANLAEVISTLALQAPILWTALYRRVGDEWLREDRLGPVSARDVLSDTIRTFSFPAAYTVTALVARELLKAAGVDEQSIALTQLMRFLALILTLPFLRAARKLFGNRPFILYPVVQAVVLVYDAATMEGLFWEIVFTAVNVVAVSGYPLMFSFQILSVLNFSPTLRNVVKAVRGPIEQLLMTCFLGMLVIYIFMVIAFWAFPEDLQDNAGFYPQSEECGSGDDEGACDQQTMCRSMISCFAVFMVNGLITGGGIGEFVSSELGNAPPIGADRTMSRYLFDLAFFAVVTIGLLNLIFGIIVDTFSSIREHENEELRTRENKCIICGLTRQEFERKEPGAWRNHYKHEHNIWAYYCFLVHLETKEPTDFNGLEDYVATCVRQNSIAWIPRNASIFLGTTAKDANQEVPPMTKTGGV